MHRSATSPLTTASYGSRLRREGRWLFMLLLGLSLFHWRGIRPGYTFLPVDAANQNLPWGNGEPKPLQNALVSDPLFQFFPFAQHAVGQVKDGGWPLWNPDIFLGHPSLADPLAQPFYPVILIFGLIFGAARGLALGLWFQAVVAAALTYGWLRTFGADQPGALAGAFTYALSGYMVTWFETTFWVSTLSLLPGVLWAFELAVQRRRWRYVAISSLLLGLAVLGGQFQFIIIFAIFLGMYALMHVWQARRKNGDNVWWPFIALTIMVVPVSLISAIFVLPVIEFLSLSNRFIVSGRVDALPLQQLITLITPDFFGNPSTPNPYWGQGNFAESTIYTGLVALLLACQAPFRTPRPFFARIIALYFVGFVYFILGGPGVDFLISLSVLKYASVHRTSFILPLLVALLVALALTDMQASGRKAMLAVAVFATVILFAYLMNFGHAQDRWETLLRPEFLQASSFLIATLGLLFLWQYDPKRAMLVKGGLVSLIFLDLTIAGSRFNPAGPVAELMPMTPAVQFLQAHVAQHRVVALQRYDKVLFGPNVLTLFDVAEAGGYSSLVINRYHALVVQADPVLDVWWMERNGNMVTFSNPSLRLLDLFQVSHVISPNLLEFADGVGAEFANDNCERAVGQIGRNNPTSGQFVVRDLAINRVDLKFRVAEPEQRKGDLRIRLWQGVDRSRLVLDTALAAAEIVDQQTVTSFFAPELHAPGNSYIWEVSAPGVDRSGIDLCADAQGQPAVSVYGSQWVHVYQDSLYIAERLAPFPRAYVVYAAEHISDDDLAVKRILDDSFDLRNVAISADRLDLPPATNTPATPAVLLEYEATRVVLQVTTEKDGLLVLGDQFYPGWTAELDGLPVPVMRVNHIMRGVLVPAGNHHITFEFRPKTLHIGAWLSTVGLLLLAIIFVADHHYGTIFDR